MFDRIAAVSVVVMLLVDTASGAPTRLASVKPSTDAQLQTLASEAVEQFIMAAPEKGRTELRKQLVEMRKAAAGSRISSKGAMLMAFEQPLGFFYAAAAVTIAPKNALVVSNFGAGLLARRRLDHAMAVLQHARDLDPKLVETHITLSSAAVSAGDTMGAEQVLRAALTKVKNDCEIWYAMGLVHILDKKPKEAVQALLKAAPCHFGGVKAKQAIAQGSDPKTPPSAPVKHPNPPPVIEVEAAGAGSKDPFVFPKHPSWGTWEALAAAGPSITKLETRSRDEFRKSSEAMIKRSEAMTSGPKFMQRFDKTPGIYYATWDREEFAIEQNGRYYEDKLEKAAKQYAADATKIDEAMNKQIEGAQRILANAVPPVPAGTMPDFKKYEGPKQAYCKTAGSIIGPAFAQWRTLNQRYYDDTTKLLREYAEVTDPWVGSIGDPEWRAQFGDIRKLFIFSKYSIVIADWNLRPIYYLPAYTTPMGYCGGKAPPPSPQSDSDEVKVAKALERCWLKRKVAMDMKLEGVPPDTTSVEIAFDKCESISVKVKQQIFPGLGFDGSVEYNYANKTWKLSVGTYAEIKYGKGPVEGSVGFGSALEFTFDKEGIQSAGWSVGPSGGAKAEIREQGFSTEHEDKVLMTIWSREPDPTVTPRPSPPRGPPKRP